jgi:hypothetical protein
MVFPGAKRFAFSILDDTDDSTLYNIKPAYDTLRELGFRTTKTVWPLHCPEGSRIFFAAETLQDKHYLDFVHEVADHGFEIAFHGATMESSLRTRTIQALEFLRQEFGNYPRLFCNHGQNQENMYWAHKRFRTPALQWLFRFLQRESSRSYTGEVQDSEYFWGDLCKKHISYVRNFTFNRVNVLAVNPGMPYRLPDTKYVNYWFSTADAPDVDAFNRLLTDDRIDELERDGGVCIVSTHVGKGFVKNGKLNANTAKILDYLARKPGWFVPVTDVLDYLLLSRCSGAAFSRWTIFELECKFLIDKIKTMIIARASHVTPNNSAEGLYKTRGAGY